MKKVLLKALIICLACCFSNKMQAQNFSLVKDINTSKDANPNHYINDLYFGFENGSFFDFGQYQGAYTLYKGIAYFEADDGIHGTELWRSDNTAAGTHMLKDINPGSNGSDIQNITVCGNKLYFTANRIVYVSDGTANGTVQVPGVTYDGDQTTSLTAVGNTLYFLTKLDRFWKTDGTAQGTSLIIDFFNVYNGQRDWSGQLTNMNGTLLFTVGSDYVNGPELWKSDGTSAGTVMVKDIYPGTAGSLPLHLTPVGNKVYFSADDGTGRKLWVTDGTYAGTNSVTNNSGVVFPAVSYYDPYGTLSFPVINKTIYFTGYTSATGDELYKYDAGKAAAGVVLVKDIIAGTASAEPKNLTAVDTTLYFSVTNTNSLQLYKTDGTTGGTKLVKNLGTDTYNYLSNFAGANNKLLFSFNTSGNGIEPWVSDGTTAGTKIIKDIFQGYYSSDATDFTYFNNGVSLFSAQDSSKGMELWSTDGTAAGTKLVKNINTTSTASSVPQLNSNAAVLNNTLFFTASNPVHPVALYISDGTSSGTKLLDLNNGSESTAANYTVFKNKMYFSAYHNGYYWLYKSNGTVSGTQTVFNNGSVNVTIAKIIAAKNYLYIFYNNYSNNTSQLWVSDGTTAGSKLVQTLPFQYSYDGAAIGDTVYFTASDATHGSELWKANNTAGSASLVKDISLGTSSSSITSFAVYNSKVYFTAIDASLTRYVFSSNGTAGGTKKLFNTPATGQPFAVANNKLFFSANDPTSGTVLYASTGTAAGTKMLTDKITGQPLSNPDHLTVFDNAVYCAASDATYGLELFKTNGTTNGTSVLKDIVAGSYSSYPFQLTATAGKLYFRLQASPYYNQLWVTNGSAAGTDSVSDAVLSGVTLSSDGMAGGDAKLFLSGYTYAYGTELYAGSVPAAQQVINNSVAKNVGAADKLTATVLGNPVQDKINLAVNSKQRQTIDIMLADASGKILINSKQFMNAGANMISYNANNLAAGIYTLKIIGEDGSSVSLKIVKQ